MIDENQCQTHTRTPWGSSSHQYPPRLRNTFIALLVFLFLGLVITAVIFVIMSMVSSSERAEVVPSFSGKEQATLIQKRHGRDDVVTEDEYFPPFNTCGDQFHGCERYYKPNYCCPFGNTCYASSLSPSGIYCCADPDKCLVSRSHIPSCIAGTVACLESVGGGCCPVGTSCSPDGCLVVEPLDEHPKFQYPDDPDPFSQLPAIVLDLVPPVTKLASAAEEAGSPVFEAQPRATYTEVKIGEMADVSASSGLKVGAMARLVAVAAFIAIVKKHCM